MVLRFHRGAIVAAMLLAANALSAQGVGEGRGIIGVAPGGRGAGTLLYGFALECERCERVTARGFGRGGGGNGIPAARATWRYTEYPRIVQVVEGSPADRAGIRVGDVLLDIDGYSILTDAGAEHFAAATAGDTIRLTIERGATTLDVSMQLGRGFGVGRGRGLIEGGRGVVGGGRGLVEGGRGVGGGRGLVGGGRGRGGRGISADTPSYSTSVDNVSVDVWSEGPVRVSTDSTGATILRTGNTTIRVRPGAVKAKK